MNTVIETPTYNGSTVLVEVMDISCINMSFHSDSESNMYAKSSQKMLSEYVLGIKEVDENYNKLIEEEDVLVSIQILFNFNRLSELTMSLPMAYDFMKEYKGIHEKLKEMPEVINNKHLKASERLAEQKIESFSKNMEEVSKELIESFNSNVERLTEDGYKKLDTLKKELGKEVVVEYGKLENILKAQQEQNKEMVNLVKKALVTTSENLENMEKRVNAILSFVEKFTNITEE